MTFWLWRILFLGWYLCLDWEVTFLVCVFLSAFGRMLCMTSQFFVIFPIYSLVNSKISAGWQSNALHIAFSVENRIAFAFPDFKIERFAVVIPMVSANSLLFILRFASITSKFTRIAILKLLSRFLSLVLRLLSKFDELV